MNYFCVAYIFGIHFEINHFLVAPIRNSLGNNAATIQHFEEEILFDTADHLPHLHSYPEVDYLIFPHRVLQQLGV